MVERGCGGGSGQAKSSVTVRQLGREPPRWLLPVVKYVLAGNERHVYLDKVRLGRRRRAAARPLAVHAIVRRGKQRCEEDFEPPFQLGDDRRETVTRGSSTTLDV